MSFTTVYFFQPKGLANKWWAFKQMRLGHQVLSKVAGQHFYKLLGSGGGNGFALWPDLGTYVLLQSWEKQEDHERFTQSNQWFANYKKRSRELGFARLAAFKAHGTWNGKEPFSKQAGSPDASLMAVLTRASIKRSLLHKFWRYVPKVSQHLSGFDGLLLAKGVGEVPLMEQATLSIWESEKLMQFFAYRDKQHARVVKKTRELNWYSEELFARFEVQELSGTYKGRELSVFHNKKAQPRSEKDALL